MMPPVQLDAREVERGRQVHDDRVDLAVLEGELGIVVGVEHLRPCGRLDLLLDRVEARGAGSRADQQALEVGDGGGAGGRRGLDRDDRLRRLVIRRAEVHCFAAVVGDGELLQVEVEVLRPGRDGLLESCAHPDDVRRGEPEFLGDGVGDRGLEALTGLGRVVDHPGVVGGLAGADRELALGDEVRHRRRRRAGGEAQGDDGSGADGDGAEDPGTGHGVSLVGCCGATIIPRRRAIRETVAKCYPATLVRMDRAAALARNPLVLWLAFVLVHLWLGLLNFTAPGLPLGDVTLVYKFWMDQAIVADFWVGIDSAWVYPIVALVPMLAAYAFGPDFYASTWLTMVMLLNALAFAVLTGWGRSRERASRRLVVGRLPLPARTHRARPHRLDHRADRDRRRAAGGNASRRRERAADRRDLDQGVARRAHRRRGDRVARAAARRRRRAHRLGGRHARRAARRRGRQHPELRHPADREGSAARSADQHGLDVDGAGRRARRRGQLRPRHPVVRRVRSRIPGRRRRG